MTSKKEKVQPILALDPVVVAEYNRMQEAEKGDELAKAEIKSKQRVLELILKSFEAQEQEVTRMAFEINPDNNYGSFSSLYRTKTNLTPDAVLKRIAGPQGDDLVNHILQARSNHIASFCRPRTSRFSIGYDFTAMKSSAIADTNQEYEQQKKMIDAATEVIWNCGFDGLVEDSHPNLSQFGKMITRSGLTFGRFAVEIIWKVDEQTGQEKPHSFRAVDAGTIYRTTPYAETDDSIRIEALRALEELKNKKIIDKDRYIRDEYKWVQVINGVPKQGFTDKELVVYNLYPTADVDYNGYPLTPIDQSIHAITTHINITLHNKLYFQNGRASRGMLVFKSDNMDEGTLQKIRLQFQQTINSVSNSWRMPVLRLGAEDDFKYESIDISGRDAEFQYLMDSNARVILSAFQMSPEELPGYSHLSRGTNTQALSESSNEYKLIAARDVGLRPLLLDIQDFFNSHILPLFFSDLAKTHQLEFIGLEKTDPEKEATRLTQDMQIHMTYDDILEKVEKDKLGIELGGEFPLNPQYQAVLDKYFTVGYILENFFGKKGAASDPRYNYVRDPFWLQYQQIVLQKVQMSMQQQMMQQQQMAQMQAQQQGQQPGEQPAQNEGSESEEQPMAKFESINFPEIKIAPVDATELQKKEIEKENLAKIQKWQQESFETMNKNIKNNHSLVNRMILKRHKEINEQKMKDLKEDSEKALSDIMKTISKNK
jgi:hypothetical protein